MARRHLARAKYALLLLALGAMGCADGAGGPNSEAPERCPNDRSALRLWNFNLSHPDTVTLKNTGDCPMDLAGVEVLFDDRDDAFPDVLIDCTVRLPRWELPSGASVRVSEAPLAGEIDALANEIAGCAYPLTFHHDRGAVIYLCDGSCDEDTLVDLVAHRGDDVDGLEPGVVENRFRDPSPLRFGAWFSEPLEGSSKFNDGLVRYQRTATTGVFPDYRSSDWGVQSRTLFADFEDGVRARSVASAPEPFRVVGGEPAEILVSSGTAASFAASLRITHLGLEDGRSDALAWSLDIFSVPRDLTYFVRTRSAGTTTGNLALLSRSDTVTELGFGPGGVGATDERGRRAEILAAADVWYRVELRDIDWTRGRFDLYVDGIRIGHELAIAADGGLVDELRLFAVSGESSSYFDAVELWGPPYVIDVVDEPDEIGILRCGIPGDRETAEGPTCDDIDGPSTLAATCMSFCSTWSAICCAESFPENYANEAECLSDCATFTPERLCCRALHGSIGGPERCRFALGVDPGGMPPACE
jgi:hypothetical protein